MNSVSLHFIYSSPVSIKYIASTALVSHAVLLHCKIFPRVIYISVEEKVKFICCTWFSRNYYCTSKRAPGCDFHFLSCRILQNVNVWITKLWHVSREAHTTATIGWSNMLKIGFTWQTLFCTIATVQEEVTCSDIIHVDYIFTILQNLYWKS